jgi:cytochrome c-type biogenesis protein CcsB
MPESQALAQLSNQLIYSAMFALTVAMVTFAVSFAQRRTGAEVVDLRQARTPVGTGARADTTGADEANAGIQLRQDDAVEAPSEQVAPAAAVGGPSDGGSDQAEPGRRVGNMALAVSWLAFALMVGGVVTRALWAGRVPWGNMYEFSLVSATAVLGVFLGVSTRRDVRWLGVFLVPAVLLGLGLAVTVLYTEAAQLVPALRSYWLVIHVSAAIVCGGGFTFAGVVAALYLVSTSGRLKALSARLPDAERLDRISSRAITFTFPLWTFAIVAGAIWAESAWGRYWGWDPKETWSFIAWVVYAAYLHARSTVGWRGRKAAWLAVAGMGVFWFNYFGVNLLFSGLHSYSGVS